jgi:major type 1 subunit fimbrin (pilin)
MKKPLLAVAIAAAPVLAFAASNNTINFQGEVTAQTCEVTINGNTGNATVLLPTVPTSALANPNDTAGLTTFTVALSGCSPSADTQDINTVLVGNQVTAAGNLGNTGSATHVQLQLLDPASSSGPFKLSSVEGFQAPGLRLGPSQTAASHDFAVQYVTEEGVATAGSVLGSVQYAISYQ